MNEAPFIQNPHFARPVFAGTGDLTYSLQRLGSGLVVEFRKHFYLFTARHSVINQNADHTKVQIPRMNQLQEWWPTDRCMLLGAASKFEHDNTFSDLAVFRLSSQSTAIRDIIPSEYISLSTSCLKIETLPLGIPLILLGYPDAEANTDFDARIANVTLREVSGFYAGTTNYLGIHLFESRFFTENDPNGFSGLLL